MAPPSQVIHRLYFKDMAYYHIAQESANGKGIADPDERITADAKLVANELSLVICEGDRNKSTSPCFVCSCNCLVDWPSFLIYNKLTLRHVHRVLMFWL